MNQTLTVNLIWGLVSFLGIVIGGAFWLNYRRDRMEAASSEPEERVPAISADELPMSESDPDLHQPIVIEETTDDDDAEPPYIEWFY